MAEQFATIGDDLEICFETFGDPADPAMLLVMGLGTQMLGWPDAFCEQLAARGYHVIRYDNRDVGRSTHFREHRPPTVKQLLMRDRTCAPYSLADMADDGIGVLDHLAIGSAHVVGVSMGGMIAQTMAARHPGRVLSLASLMSNTGHRWRGMPGLRAYPIFLRKPVIDKAAAIDSVIATFKLIGSPDFPFDEDELRAVAERSYMRGYDPSGTGRQLAAIIAAGDRTAEVATITAPTLVVHGTRDVMVTPSGGKATARAIKGAQLVLIEGMGHDLPLDLWERIIGLVARNTARAQTHRAVA
jgi:pimeloyl-ACP methyl ester carboxylesterase